MCNKYPEWKSGRVIAKRHKVVHIWKPLARTAAKKYDTCQERNSSNNITKIRLSTINGGAFSTKSQHKKSRHRNFSANRMWFWRTAEKIGYRYSTGMPWGGEGQELRGTVLNRTYGTHKIYTWYIYFVIFTNNSWSYLLGSPVIASI